MSEESGAPEIGLAEFRARLERYSKTIEEAGELTTGDSLEIGRLWNTELHYSRLLTDEPERRFYELVRDQALPKIVQALDMVVSRGMSFHSPKYDFTIGGILEPRHRYRIPELEKQEHP